MLALFLIPHNKLKNLHLVETTNTKTTFDINSEQSMTVLSSFTLLTIKNKAQGT